MKYFHFSIYIELVYLWEKAALRRFVCVNHSNLIKIPKLKMNCFFESTLKIYGDMQTPFLKFACTIYVYLHCHSHIFFASYHRFDYTFWVITFYLCRTWNPFDFLNFPVSIMRKINQNDFVFSNLNIRWWQWVFVCSIESKMFETFPFGKMS